jgi:alanine racemase
MSTVTYWDQYPARAVVDLGAIRNNIEVLQEAAPRAEVMAVVKADAYGHGLLPVAQAAVDAGATWLGTAQASEALRLRSGGITTSCARILTWLHSPGAPYADLIKSHIDVSAPSLRALDEIAAAAEKVKMTAYVHVKVDTGLGRNGIMPADLPAFAARAAEYVEAGDIVIEGLWSHLAYADDIGHPTIARQREIFDMDYQVLLDAGIPPRHRHIANSAATLLNPEMHFDIVRPGISVYGYSPVPTVAPPSEFGLTPAMTLQASIATVKHVPANTGVSYSHKYHTHMPTNLGIVPLGYADGIPRHASGSEDKLGGPVVVGAGEHERIEHVAGRVCMDQIVLDLGPDATEQIGDTVTLFGASDGLAFGAKIPNAEDWALAADTISYEIITRLGVRIPRLYVGESRAAQ